MQHIKIKFINDFSFRPEEYHDQDMYTLGEFFRCEVTNDTKYWINWINNSKSLSKCGNWMWLDKIQNDYIIIGDGTIEPYDGYNPIPEGVLWIKNSELIKLLEKWSELYNSKAQEIMITKDGDVFEMYEIVA